MTDQQDRGFSINLIGLNHRTAPLVLRERLTFNAEEIVGALQGLVTAGSEAYILCTCNRTDVILISERTDALESTRDFLARSRGVSRDELDSHCYGFTGEDAVRHLFEVASGLDSMVLGEAQILGQVADAFEVASSAGTVGRVLGRVLPLALETGKKARTQTRISHGLLSPSSVAVDLARNALGNLEACSVLVIGAGDAGQATVRSLVAAGVTKIVVANRSFPRAKEIAATLGGSPLPQSEILNTIERVDIVISSTGASELIVRADEVAEVMRRRPGRPLLCIDIAVPRDLDPALAEIPEVLLYNVDDLEAVCAAHLEDRRRESGAVVAIVDEGLEDFRAWKSAQRVVPTIGALFRHAEEIRRSEVERTVRRMPSLSTEDLDRIEAMTSAIVSRILHDPVAALRARASDATADDLVRSLQELFHLPVEELEAVGPSA